MERAVAREPGSTRKPYKHVVHSFDAILNNGDTPEDELPDAVILSPDEEATSDG